MINKKILKNDVVENLKEKFRRKQLQRATQRNKIYSRISNVTTHLHQEVVREIYEHTR